MVICNLLLFSVCHYLSAADVVLLFHFPHLKLKTASDFYAVVVVFSLFYVSLTLPKCRNLNPFNDILHSLEKGNGQKIRGTCNWNRPWHNIFMRSSLG